jgi:hypothetical protein
MKRTVPNLPAALTHHLRRSLAIDPTTAMRVALLYGDLEWQAEGSAEVRWSARDYARRHGFSRNTVRADLERLQRLGAISFQADGADGTTYRLHGLGVPAAGGGSPVEPPEGSDPGSILEPPGSLSEPPPGSPAEPPLAHALSHPLAQRVSHIRKEEPKEREKRRGKRAAHSQPVALTSGSNLDRSLTPPGGPAPGTSLPKGQLQAKPQGQSPASGESNSDPLLAQLLACFQRHCPPEWSTPQRLSLTGGRRARLRRALEHAGGTQELLARLERALVQVPPWFRSTYPQLPDGSRRPSHQFFDLLFRAAAHERDAGPEAWHLFAWSESPPSPARAGDPRPEAAGSGLAAELEQALALLAWDGHHWRGQGVEALQLSRSEKRRLAERLEEAGYGQKGTAARQYAEPDPAADLTPNDPPPGP